MHAPDFGQLADKLGKVNFTHLLLLHRGLHMKKWLDTIAQAVQGILESLEAKLQEQEARVPVKVKQPPQNRGRYR